MGSIAEFEASLIRERTNAGLTRARARGAHLGRPSQINAHQFRTIHEMKEAGKSYSVIAATTGLTVAQVGRVIRGEIASLAHLSPARDEGELPLYGELGP